MRTLKMNELRLSISAVALAAVVFYVAWAVNAEPRAGFQQKEQEKKVSVGVQKERLKADCRAITSGGREAPSLGSGSGPIEASIMAMEPGEREELAVAAGRLHDRLLHAGCLTASEFDWEKRVLSRLSRRDGSEAAVLITRVYRDSVGASRTMEQLNQVESLLRTVHSEMVACGEAEPGEFDRSKIKKALLRKKLSLMKEDK